MIAPGATIGILGGGQLGRMLAIAAANLGYRAHIYAPGPSGPASEVSAHWTRGDYHDAAAVARFAEQVAIVTYEFENVDSAALAPLSVRPGPRALDVAQDRLAEKEFVAALGGRTAPFRTVDSLADLDRALEEVGAPAILKTRRMGYDGKGQARILAPRDTRGAWAIAGQQPSILEGMVRFAHEFSIVAVRGADGHILFWDPATNEHRDGILVRTTVPPPPAVTRQAAEARALVTRIAEALHYVGVLSVEFFCGEEGPIFNEMAPRVHNSGHWTTEGAITSQFENHIRAICGLPLGSTALAAAEVEMRNLIGDEAAAWAQILADPAAHLHLYGKLEARPGRKMGHVTRLGF
ncbi:MAG: 5-(carboxyamino)imidazole ribonucleotide synthase [Sphingomonas fennica]